MFWVYKISLSDCAVTITQPFGVITSPGFPQLYRNGIDCTWNIQLSSGQLIHFFFLQFDVEDDYAYGCGWDTSASDIFPTKLIVGFYHAKKLILI